MEIAIYLNMTKPLINSFKPCTLIEFNDLIYCLKGNISVRSKPYFMYNEALAI